MNPLDQRRLTEVRVLPLHTSERTCLTDCSVVAPCRLLLVIEHGWRLNSISCKSRMTESRLSWRKRHQQWLRLEALCCSGRGCNRTYSMHSVKSALLQVMLSCARAEAVCLYRTHLLAACQAGLATWHHAAVIPIILYLDQP